MSLRILNFLWSVGTGDRHFTEKKRGFYCILDKNQSENLPKGQTMENSLPYIIIINILNFTNKFWGGGLYLGMKKSKLF